MNVKVKQRIPLKINEMGINGKELDFIRKTLVLLGALKGEEVYCQVTRIQRTSLEAKLLTINKSRNFAEAPCRDLCDSQWGLSNHNSTCDKQLEFKEDLSRQALKNLRHQAMRTMRSVRLLVRRRATLLSWAKLQFQTRKLLDEVKAGLMPRILPSGLMKNCLVQDKVTQQIISLRWLKL